MRGVYALDQEIGIDLRNRGLQVRILPGVLFHPANFRLHDGSQSESLSLGTTLSLKSPMFWAFLIFSPQCVARSLFIPRAVFSECCFRPNGIFFREPSRSLVDK